MKKFKQVFVFILLAIMILPLSGCGGDNYDPAAITNEEEANELISKKVSIEEITNIEGTDKYKMVLKNNSNFYFNSVPLKYRGEEYTELVGGFICMRPGESVTTFTASPKKLTKNTELIFDKYNMLTSYETTFTKEESNSVIYADQLKINNINKTNDNTVEIQLENLTDQEYTLQEYDIMLVANNGADYYGEEKNITVPAHGTASMQITGIDDLSTLPETFFVGAAKR